MARVKPQRNPERLDIRMSFSVRYGEADEDQLVVMQERPMRLVGSVFHYRDRILQTLATTLVRVAVLQPKVAKRVFGRRRRADQPDATRGD